MRTAATHASRGRRPRLLPQVALALLPALGSAQTAPLNDTGQDLCYDGGALVACTADSTAPYPGQDGRFGRDAARAAGVLPAKTGGGAAGFDFTALNASGNPTTPGGHACVKDNVTGLTWEVKPTTPNTSLRYAGHTYTWYDSTRPSEQGSQGGNSCNATLPPGSLCNTQAYVAAVNAAGLCGKSDWRLPTSQELLSIVHNGVWNPSIDTTYFPDSSVWTSVHWWTSETYAPVPANAWLVDFVYGGTVDGNKTFAYWVRLVRSGP